MRASPALALLAVAAVCAVVAPAAGSSSPPRGAAEVAALLRGIPQHSVSLGRPSAPVTLVEFADLQCPYCAEWATRAFPEIVKRYVRTGKVRMVFVGMTFLGPDSARGFRAVLAAGRQDRLWHVLELLYLNQGEEGSGWVTDAFLRRLGGSVTGLDVGAMLRARTSATVEAELTQAARFVESAGVDRTPTFAASNRGKPLKLLPVARLDAGGIAPILDALLKS